MPTGDRQGRQPRSMCRESPEYHDKQPSVAGSTGNTVARHENTGPDRMVGRMSSRQASGRIGQKAGLRETGYNGMMALPHGNGTPERHEREPDTTGLPHQPILALSGSLSGCRGRPAGSPPDGHATGLHAMNQFVAIDFETASYSRASACALGLVQVAEGRIIAEKTLLIRPPQRRFHFTYIHGLGWEDVREAPTFAECWDVIDGFIAQADFLAAHNAPFDRGVLQGCCEHYGIALPERPFVCTVQLARRQWEIYPTKLPNVCDYLDIPLNHHEAGSDSRACAQIVIAAERAGWRF